MTGEPLTLVTGIARPAPLLQYLRTCGIDFEHMEFPDHHRFTSREMRRISSLPLVLTTEKDYRRMDDPPENLYYIRVRHKFLGNGLEVLKKRLESL